jgi:type I restriction enzyme M protein
MANRPIFIPINIFPYVEEKLVEFKWHSGFAISQKQKSISELHNSATELNYCKAPLEVSSKSKLDLGISLSAFNLQVMLENKKKIALENVFQAAKIFQNGGPFYDLLYVSPLEAKRDIRLKESGDLVGFKGKNRVWGLEPKTLFYDWIYLNALYLNPDLVEGLRDYDSFTDIEFNPKKSFNCQASSVALYLGLQKANLLSDILKDPEYFIEVCTDGISGSSDGVHVQKSLI